MCGQNFHLENHKNGKVEVSFDLTRDTRISKVGRKVFSLLSLSTSMAASPSAVGYCSMFSLVKKEEMSLKLVCSKVSQLLELK